MAAPTEEHKALIDAYKAAGLLPADYRYDYKIPKRLLGKKSTMRDKQALEELRRAEESEKRRQAAEAEMVGVVDDVVDTAEDISPVTPGGTGGMVPDMGDPDDIAWNKAELRRLVEKKRLISDELLALTVGDKDGLALCKQKLALIESQEKSCRDSLNQFNKKRLDMENSANLVLIRIEDHTGDSTGIVETWV